MAKNYIAPEDVPKGKDGIRRRGNPQGNHDAFIERGTKRNGQKRKARKVQQLSSGGAMVRIKKSQSDIIEGKDNLEEWSLEELIVGRRKGHGRMPAVIPIEVHQELARRVLMEAKHNYVANLGYAVDKQMAIMKGIKMEERQVHGAKKGVTELVAVDVTPVQYKAVVDTIERVMGMPHEQVDINIAVEKPYEKLLASAIVSDAAALAEMEEANIVDAELVEDDEDGD